MNEEHLKAITNLLEREGLWPENHKEYTDIRGETETGIQILIGVQATNAEEFAESFEKEQRGFSCEKEIKNRILNTPGGWDGSFGHVIDDYRSLEDFEFKLADISRKLYSLASDLEQ